MKITKIETIHVEDYPQILFVAVHTDEGLVGYGDTFYMTDAVRGYVHQFAAPMLLGHDPLAIELHWRRLYEVIAHIAGKGAEIRGLSAIDVALWDILGQAAGMPIWQVLGGAARDRIKTYNTCGGPTYGRPTRGGTGYGTDTGSEGKYEDLIAFMTARGRTGPRSAQRGHHRHEDLALRLYRPRARPVRRLAHLPGRVRP